MKVSRQSKSGSRILALALAFLMVFSSLGIEVLAASGSQDDPVSVIEAKRDNTGKKYVVGYIVGHSLNTNNYNFDGNFSNDYNLAIADSPEERDPAKIMPVRLKVSLRSQWGLKSNPDLLGSKVLIYGSLGRYFATAGISEVDSIEAVEEKTLSRVSFNFHTGEYLSDEFARLEDVSAMSAELRMLADAEGNELEEPVSYKASPVPGEPGKLVLEDLEPGTYSFSASFGPDHRFIKAVDGNRSSEGKLVEPDSSFVLPDQEDPDADREFYFQLEKIIRNTISVDPNGGSIKEENATFRLPQGSRFTMHSQEYLGLEKPGYKLVGYEVEGSLLDGDNNLVKRIEPEQKRLKPLSDIVLKAIWEAESFTVNFNFHTGQYLSDEFAPIEDISKMSAGLVMTADASGKKLDQPLSFDAVIDEENPGRMVVRDLEAGSYYWTAGFGPDHDFVAKIDGNKSSKDNLVELDFSFDLPFDGEDPSTRNFYFQLNEVLRYTITVDPDGGQIKEENAVFRIRQGNSFNMHTADYLGLEREGYELVGYQVAEGRMLDADGQAVDEIDLEEKGLKPQSDILLKAIWEKEYDLEEDEVVLKFDTTGYDVDQPEDMIVKKDISIKDQGLRLPMLENTEDQYFSNWLVRYGSYEKYTVNSFVPRENTTLYPAYKDKFPGKFEALIFVPNLLKPAQDMKYDIYKDGDLVHTHNPGEEAFEIDEGDYQIRIPRKYQEEAGFILESLESYSRDYTYPLDQIKSEDGDMSLARMEEDGSFVLDYSFSKNGNNIGGGRKNRHHLGFVWLNFKARPANSDVSFTFHTGQYLSDQYQALADVSKMSAAVVMVKDYQGNELEEAKRFEAVPDEENPGRLVVRDLEPGSYYWTAGFGPDHDFVAKIDGNKSSKDNLVELDFSFDLPYKLGDSSERQFFFQVEEVLRYVIRVDANGGKIKEENAVFRIRQGNSFDMHTADYLGLEREGYELVGYQVAEGSMLDADGQAVDKIDLEEKGLKPESDILLKAIWKEVVDKSELEELVAKAGEIDKDSLTDDSRKALEEAIARAKEVLADEDITGKEYEKALAEFKDTLANLEYKQVLNMEIDPNGGQIDPEFTSFQVYKGESFKLPYAFKMKLAKKGYSLVGYQVFGKIYENGELVQEVSKYPSPLVGETDTLFRAIWEVSKGELILQIYDENPSSLKDRISVRLESLDSHEMTSNSYTSSYRDYKLKGIPNGDYSLVIDGLDLNYYDFVRHDSMQAGAELKLDEDGRARLSLEFEDDSPTSFVRYKLLPKLALDRTALEKLVELAEEIDKDSLTDESRRALEEALAKAKEALAEEELKLEDYEREVEALKDVLAGLEVEPEEIVHKDAYAKDWIKIYDQYGQETGQEIGIGYEVSGILVGDYLKLDDGRGYVRLSDIQAYPILGSGYASFTQWIRDESEEKTGILPIGYFVHGRIRGHRLIIDSGEFKGQVYRQNLSPDRLYEGGYAKFTQVIRDMDENVIGYIYVGDRVDGYIRGSRLVFIYQGQEVQVYRKNLGPKEKPVRALPRFDQYVRDKHGRIIGIIKKEEVVEGLEIGVRIEFEFKGQRAYVYKKNVNRI